MDQPLSFMAGPIHRPSENLIDHEATDEARPPPPLAATVLGTTVIAAVIPSIDASGIV